MSDAHINRALPNIVRHNKKNSAFIYREAETGFTDSELDNLGKQTEGKQSAGTGPVSTLATQ